MSKNNMTGRQTIPGLISVSGLEKVAGVEIRQNINRQQLLS
jgi:hypothetical protein